METPKEYYYTYYSYEEWGRGYIGSRGCKCLPEEDVNYFGSSKDKTFKPTQKIILSSDYATREDAYADEIILQQYYKVVENPHFANKAYQTSTKFYIPINQAIENGKKIALKNKQTGTGIFALTPEQLSERNRKNGLYVKENKIGIFALTHEQRSETSKKVGANHRENKTGICGRTLEKMSEDGKRGADKIKELGLGIYSITPEQRIENSRKAGLKNKENGTGIFALTQEQKDESSRKAVITNKKNKTGIFSLSSEQLSENAKRTSSQRWMCLETGYISNAGGLSGYQRARGIDTSKRKRIE